MNDTKRILILTGSFGEGHNTAARNLQAAFRERGVEAEVFDFFAHAYPEISSVLQKGYAFAINHAPAVWKRVYQMAESDSANLFSVGPLTQEFAEALAARDPSIVVSTFPFHQLFLAKLFPTRESRPFAWHTVVTDAISIHAMWWRGLSDRTYVIDEHSRAVVIEGGVEPDRVLVTGFPIAFRFVDSVRPLLPPGQTRARLLYLPTTRRPHVRATLEALCGFCQRADAELTIVLGKHEKRLAALVEEVRMALPSDLLEVRGWERNVPGLMAERHVVITKAGGATVNEALGAQCPLLINYVVPGQEEGNARLVEESGAGLRVRDPESLAPALRSILVENDGALWRAMRSRLKRLDGAGAALRIADAVLGGR